jgi:hypothetical protein
VQVKLTSTRAAQTLNTKGFPGARAARRKFLHFFPEGFTDETYLEWERNYKWQAHRHWTQVLNQREMERLLAQREYSELARRAIQIESRTNLLFSFEKMALRDAIRTPTAARQFAIGLRDFLYGRDSAKLKFNRWCEAVGALPRKQTRVLTWPLVTVFGFLASPARHIFLKPMVTRRAAEQYGFPFKYQSRPNWDTYASVVEFARAVRRDLTSMHPRDLIDIQSFLWVQGSDEYD